MYDKQIRLSTMTLAMSDAQTSSLMRSADVNALAYMYDDGHFNLQGNF
jgi:hypothetical protein